MVPSCRSGVVLPPPAGNVRFSVWQRGLVSRTPRSTKVWATGCWRAPNNRNILNPAVAASSAPSPERSRSKWQNVS